MQPYPIMVNVGLTLLIVDLLALPGVAPGLPLPPQFPKAALHVAGMPRFHGDRHRLDAIDGEVMERRFDIGHLWFSHMSVALTLSI